MKATTSITAILISAGAVSAQVTYDSVNNSYSCPVPNGAYCVQGSLKSNIIIRCVNGVGYGGNSGVPPVGVKTGALCYETDPKLANAQCVFNCVPYKLPNGQETYPVGCVTSTESATAPSITPTVTQTGGCNVAVGGCSPTVTVSPTNTQTGGCNVAVGGCSPTVTYPTGKSIQTPLSSYPTQSSTKTNGPSGNQPPVYNTKSNTVTASITVIDSGTATAADTRTTNSAIVTNTESKTVSQTASAESVPTISASNPILSITPTAYDYSPTISASNPILTLSTTLGYGAPEPSVTLQSVTPYTGAATRPTVVPVVVVLVAAAALF